MLKRGERPKVTLRLRPEEVAFLDKLKATMKSDRTTAIRFCLHFTEVFLGTKIVEMKREELAELFAEAYKRVLTE